MKISFANVAVPARGAVVVAVAESKQGRSGGKRAGLFLAGAALAVDKRTRSALSRAIAAASFTGRRDKTLQVIAPGDGCFSRVVLVGVGDVATLDEPAAERL